MEDIRYPSNYNVDITGFCNLRCRFCPEGKKVNEQPQRLMSLEEFIEISNSFLPYAKKIGLLNWSEPFLNKDVHKIVSYIKEKSKETSVVISTNANHFTQEDASNLIKSRLDYLVISTSGITQEGYERYHVGGDLNKVLKTLECITEAKERYKSPLPFIEVVYLLFPFNYISLRKFKKFLYGKLGEVRFKQINYIRLNYGYLAGTDLGWERLNDIYGPDIRVYKYPKYLKPACYRAHNEPGIRADGTVFPCCAITYDPKYGMGNLKLSSFKEIWQSKKYCQFRESFCEGTNQLCKDCTWYFVDNKIKMDRYLFYRIKRKLWLIKNLRFGRR